MLPNKKYKIVGIALIIARFKIFCELNEAYEKVSEYSNDRWVLGSLFVPVDWLHLTLLDCIQKKS